MIIKIVVLAFSVCMVSLILKQDFKPGAVLISIAGCFIVFAMSLDIVFKIGESFAKVKNAGGVNGECLSLILKMLAVAYATSFGADICCDAGEKAMASAVENVGKLIMLAMALPMLAGIYESVAEMMG